MSTPTLPIDPERLVAAVGRPPTVAGTRVFLECAVEELQRQKLDLEDKAPLDWFLLVRRVDLDEPLYGLGTYATVDYNINFNLPEQYQQKEAAEGNWSYGDVVAPESSERSEYPWSGLAEVETEIAAEFKWGDADAVVESLTELCALPNDLVVEAHHEHTLVDLLGREWTPREVQVGAIRAEIERFGLKSIQRVREDQGRSPKAKDLLPFIESDRDEMRGWALRLVGRTGD